MQHKHWFRISRLGGAGVLLGVACAAQNATAYDLAGQCVDVRALSGDYAGAYSGTPQPQNRIAGIAGQSAYAPHAAAQVPPQALAAAPAYQAYPPRAYVPTQVVAAPVAAPVVYAYPPAQVVAMAVPYPPAATQWARQGPGGVITPEQRRLQELNQQFAR